MLRVWAANAVIETAALLSKYFIHSPLKCGMFWAFSVDMNLKYSHLLDRTTEEHLPQLLVCCLSFQRGKKKGPGCSEAIVVFGLNSFHLPNQSS